MPDLVPLTTTPTIYGCEARLNDPGVSAFAYTLTFTFRAYLGAAPIYATISSEQDEEDIDVADFLAAAPDAAQAAYEAMGYTLP